MCVEERKQEFLVLNYNNYKTRAISGVARLDAFLARTSLPTETKIGHGELPVVLPSSATAKKKTKTKMRLDIMDIVIV